MTERTKKTALQEAFGDFGRIIRIEALRIVEQKRADLGGGERRKPVASFSERRLKDPRMGRVQNSGSGSRKRRVRGFPKN